MSEYVIEKGIPPTKRRTDGKTALLRQMEIGDSILVPTDREAENFRTCATFAQMKVSVRKVENGVRVWRVA
jgi:hypothetical protein